jgi:secondary thiamine-phosphate synthase enzyme
MEIIDVQTQSRQEFFDLTPRVRELTKASGIERGVCLIYVPHTTAAVTINENADPSVKEDIVETLAKVIPESLPYSHSEGNSPAHIKASLVGPSVSLIVDDGELILGTWQGIFFCEFDGPRRRKVYVRFTSS